MKVIDHTPYFGADGKISVLNQAKATMKLGAAWVQETQAQVGVMAALERGLDRKFTLLRNVTLPGLDISIPLILVGPTGVYAMYVTAARGMYRAKGDVWGMLAGNTFKPSSANLLTRTARMARAVQVYLQRQGYEGAGVVDAALLCANPGLHVDSVRPIVRVVQSDALERFAVLIAQARAALSPEAVAEVVNRILTPKPAKAAEQAAAPAAPAPEEEPYVPSFALPGGEPPQPAAPPVRAGDFGFDFKEDAAPKDETPFGAAPQPRPGQARPPVRKRRRFSTRQWIFLIVFAVFECIILFVFLYLVSQNI
ncbi:MAG: hypothetical protein FD146_2222 [Anaerolineaceae bacterium]|nr:MAG: hypothetical protein FD146_2222 [Anaerolineaceae bacterium]